MRVKSHLAFINNINLSSFFIYLSMNFYIKFIWLSVLSYLNSLEKFWVDYYTLRRLTLYDFIENKKIEVNDIIYD